MNPLRMNPGIPLEREYESWIVWGIEEYFRSLDINVTIWAVPPMIEANWPSDESVLIGTKLFGLQIKRPKLANTKRFAGLKWDLDRPLGQYELIRAYKHIYYCLPTFFNRNLRRQALHHTLIWRPRGNNRSAWYDNNNARANKHLKKARRWGLFFEDLCRCSVGVRIRSPSDAASIYDDIGQLQNAEALAAQEIEGSREYGSPVYFIAVPFERT